LGESVAHAVMTPHAARIRAEFTLRMAHKASTALRRSGTAAADALSHNA
jgi:hypothetical protein